MKSDDSFAVKLMRLSIISIDGDFKAQIKIGRKTHLVKYGNVVKDCMHRSCRALGRIGCGFSPFLRNSRRNRIHAVSHIENLKPFFRKFLVSVVTKGVLDYLGRLSPSI